MPEGLKSFQTADIIKGSAVFKVWTSPKGIRRLELPELDGDVMKRKGLRFHININKSPAEAEVEWIESLVDFIGAVLEGKEPVACPPVDLDALSGFTRGVLERTGGIPRGETRCYSWVARETGCPGGARAVGGALGRNTVPLVVPCHRVILKDGSPGGFASGVEWKRWLLELEMR